MAKLHTNKNAAEGVKRYEVRWSERVGTNPDGTPKRRFRSRRFANREPAKAFLREVEADLAGTGRYTASEGGKDALGEWVDRWLVFREAEVARGRIRISSLHSNEQVANLTVKPMLGKRPIRSLTVVDVDDFIDRVQAERGVTPQTAKHHYGVLRQVLAFAVRRGAIPTNPAIGARVANPGDPSTRRVFEPVALTEEQVAALAQAMHDRAPDTPYPLMVLFMAHTGLRAGEVGGLNVGDVKLPKGEVHVRQIRVKGKARGATDWQINRPKTGKVRRVPILQPWLRDDLAAYLAQHPHRADPDAPLWPGSTCEFTNDPETGRISKVTTTPDYSKPWDRDPFYRRQFKPAVEAAGLPHLRLHDLRHTAGSLMLSRGVPDYRVADYLGHSVDVLRKIYTHVLNPDIDADRALFAADERPALAAPNGHHRDNVARLHA